MNSTKQKKILVVSHYCPTKLGTMNNHHKRDDFNGLVPYYFSSSEKYLKQNLIDTWVFGHTHVLGISCSTATRHESSPIQILERNFFDAILSSQFKTDFFRQLRDRDISRK